jgi:O-antigen ligase/predicted Zn-dependent protease
MASTLALGYSTFEVVQRSPGGRRRLFYFVVGAGTLEALIGLLQASGIVLSAVGKGAHTAAGTFRNRNYLSGLLEVCLFASLAKGLDLKESASRRPLFLYAAILMLAAVGVSSSRGGWISCTLGLLVFTLVLSLRRRDWRPIVGAAILLALASSLAFSTASKVIEQRSETLELEALEDSEWMRRSLWGCANEITKAYPLFGVGVGNFGTYLPAFRPRGIYMERWNCYQDYLQTAAEGGIPAFLLLLAVLGLLTVRLLKQAFQSPQERRSLFATGALASLSAFCAHSFVDFNLRIPSNAAMLMILMVATLTDPAKTALPSAEEDPDSTSSHSTSSRASYLTQTLLLLAGATSLLFYLHDLHIQRAKRDLAAGKLAQAVEEAKRAQDWLPANPEAFELQAKALHKLALSHPKEQAQRELKESRQAFEHALQLTPTDGRTQLALAQLLSHDQSVHLPSLPGAYLQRLEELSKSYPNDPEILIPLGVHLQKVGRDKEGIQILLDGFSAIPSTRFRTRFIQPFLEKGGDILSMKPFMPENSAPGWALIASAHSQQGQFIQALEAWRKAAKAFPDGAGPRIGAASSLIALGREKEAREELTAARHLADPPPEDYFTLLHALQVRAKDFTGALATAQEATKLFPESIPWMVLVCRHQWKTGNSLDALNRLRSLVSRYENSPAPHETLGDILQEQGIQEENRQLLRKAAFHYREALLRNRHAFGAARSLAALYFRLGDRERTQPLLQDLIANQAATPLEQARLADLWTTQKRFRGALRLLMKIPRRFQGLQVEGQTIASRIHDLKALIASTASEVEAASTPSGQ